MASGGKKKTTMAKLTRESKLRERRLDKQAKREARKLAPAGGPDEPIEMLNPLDGEVGDAAHPDDGEVALERVAVETAAPAQSDV